MANFSPLPPHLLSKTNHGYIYRLLRDMVILFIFPAMLISCSAPEIKDNDLGNWSQTTVERLLNEAKEIKNPGERTTFISAAFLGTPYLANTLVGSTEIPEEFVLRLDGVDCFTFLDYVEALRRATDFESFKKILRQIRYRDGSIHFLNRNHFFSDWNHGDSAQLLDVTTLVGEQNVSYVEKHLNEKAGGAFYLPGYPVNKRIIAFIPPDVIDTFVFSRLHSGDYVGIYSPLPGLDVSHTGIIIKKAGKVFLRHASSNRNLNKVVDEELLPYLKGEKGLIIYRPIDTD